MDGDLHYFVGLESVGSIMLAHRYRQACVFGYFEGWAFFFAFFSATACSAIVLLYSCASDAEQIISRISNHSGCNRKRNLFKGLHGFVYILGSSIVIVNSIMSWFTRCQVSVTFNSSLSGRPTLSIHVLSSSPTVCVTNV